MYSGNGAFHKYLAALGKTPLDSDEELELLHGFYNHSSGGDNDEFRRGESIVTNPVFVVEISQLSSASSSSSSSSSSENQNLGRDLQDFLSLSIPLNETIPHSNAAGQSRKIQTSKRRQIIYKNYKMDICDPINRRIHDEMLSIARNASRWITQYFLPLEDVQYSGNLPAILDSWMIDPCIARRQRQKQQQEQHEEQQLK